MRSPARTLVVLACAARVADGWTCAESWTAVVPASRASAPLLVERTGAHALYVDESYPCQFRDAPELRALLARLAARPELLAECRKRGLALVEARFSPAAIARKYGSAARRPRPCPCSSARTGR